MTYDCYIKSYASISFFMAAAFPIMNTIFKLLNNDSIC